MKRHISMAVEFGVAAVVMHGFSQTPMGPGGRVHPWENCASCAGGSAVVYRTVPVNSGLMHYVYPSGQCEETCRNQGHMQMGLGYLADTCVAAWDRGVDLFAETDKRLALGVEYIARYMLGSQETRSTA
jgi:hypothetical protein